MDSIQLTKLPPSTGAEVVIKPEPGLLTPKSESKKYGVNGGRYGDIFEKLKRLVVTVLETRDTPPSRKRRKRKRGKSKKTACVEMMREKHVACSSGQTKVARAKSLRQEWSSQDVITYNCVS